MYGTQNGTVAQRRNIAHIGAGLEGGRCSATVSP